MPRVEAENPAGEEPLWAYAYQLIPPRPSDRLAPILTLVEQENAHALRDARKWTGRLVVEDQVTHVLVLSDAPDADRDANRRLEAMLRDLDVRYSVTLPMRVDDDAAPQTETP